jgi:ketosteroid isomerase-like protein
VTDTSVYVEGLSDWEQIVGTGIERIVLDFVHGAYGEHMDVEAMTALMADDFVWQLNVPLSPVIRGRDAARAELEKHNQLASGMVDGSEIRTVVSNEDTGYRRHRTAARQ